MFTRISRLILIVAFVCVTAPSARAANPISFLPPVSYTGTGASGITAVDLDGDGNLDLIVGDIGGDRLSLLYGRGDGTFEPPVEMHLNKDYHLALGSDHQIIAADVNGDGLPDLIVPDSALGKVLVFINQGHRTYAAPVGYPTGQVRKPIEGVIATLTECLGIEHLLVRTDYGLYRRLQAKATAFSLARYFNRALGLDPMDFARYAV